MRCNPPGAGVDAHTRFRHALEGPVYRVDLRLRPQGSSGEMVVGLNQAARYYQGQAHDWELQALLKLRHAAGDATLAREFIRFAQPLVYREALSRVATQIAVRSLHVSRRCAAPAVRRRVWM